MAIFPALDAAPTFQRIYERHVGYVWSAIRAHGVGSPDVEDLVQEVFVVLFRRYADLDHARELRPWLFGVVRRVVGQHRRRYARRGATVQHVPATQLDALVGSDTDERERRGEASRLLRAFLAGLAADHRDVFVLSELVDLTAREIGELFGLSPNTVASRLRAGRREFDRFLRRLHAREQADAVLHEVRTSLRPSATERQRMRTVVAAAVMRTPWTASVGLPAWVGSLAIASVTAALGVLTATTAPVDARVPIEAPVVPAELDHIATTAKASVPASFDPPPRFTATPSSTVKREQARTADDPLARELRMLRVIEGLVEANPDRALRTIEAHARRFPSSVLTDERETLRFAALCRLGRPNDAIAAVRRHPSPRLAALAANGCSSSP